MSTETLKKSNKIIRKWCSAIVTIIQCIPTFTMAQNNDQDIFNQFYKEIINSATVGKPQKTDSIELKRLSGLIDQKSSTTSVNASDAVSERLKNEIEKNVKDFQLRHNNAVRFMQEEK